MIQSGVFLGKLLGPLLKTGLAFIEPVKELYEQVKKIILIIWIFNTASSFN